LIIKIQYQSNIYYVVESMTTTLLIVYNLVVGVVE